MVKGIVQFNIVGDMDYVSMLIFCDFIFLLLIIFQIVVDVWCGFVLILDGVLQFLFFVDYVFDWVRDVYCDEIISMFWIFVFGDNDVVSVLYVDLNIFFICFIDQFELYFFVEEDENYKVYVLV